jgi:hypothetical protein
MPWVLPVPAIPYALLVCVPPRCAWRPAPGRGDFLISDPGGSLEATRRSFNKDFLLALAADFKKHGAAAIEKVRKKQPAAYMKICALLVPREMKLEHSGGVKEMIAQREAGAGAKVIEGEAEELSALPAPATPAKAS